MKINKNIKRELIIEFLFFIVGIVIISYFYINNILLTFLLIVGGIIFVKLLPKKYDIYYFISAAILGSFGEAICIYFGAWQYTNPSYFGIPIWLPFVWGYATLILRRISETFVKMKI